MLWELNNWKTTTEIQYQKIMIFKKCFLKTNIWIILFWISLKFHCQINYSKTDKLISIIYLNSKILSNSKQTTVMNGFIREIKSMNKLT